MTDNCLVASMKQALNENKHHLLVTPGASTIKLLRPQFNNSISGVVG